MTTRKLVIAAALAGAALGCSTQDRAPIEPEPATEAHAAAAPPAPGPAEKPLPPNATAASPAPAPAEKPLPPNAEVEFAGEVTLPAGVKGRAKVYVLDGRCFASTSLALSEVIVSRKGRYGGEVFVPQRTPLWFCAAIEEDGVLRYGGSASEQGFVAEGRGEVYAPHATIALRPLKPPAKPPRKLDLID